MKKKQLKLERMEGSNFEALSKNQMSKITGGAVEYSHTWNFSTKKEVVSDRNVDNTCWEHLDKNGVWVD